MTEFEAAWQVGDLPDRLALVAGYAAGLLASPAGIALMLLLAAAAATLIRRRKKNR